MVRVIDQNDQFPSHSFSLCGNDFTTNSAASSSTIAQSTINDSSQTFICIITDLTDASNTCKRHVINLSGSYTVEYLIREAANFYSYDPFTFNLMWKSSLNNDMVNLSEINQSSMSLETLGLVLKKNTFEIHEKDGPPKRIPNTDECMDESQNFFGYKNNSNNLSTDNLNMMEPVNYPSLIENSLSSGTYPPRKNAGIDSMPTMGMSLSSSYYNNYEDENTGYVGLINQAMTCYLNSLIQTLFMTPEFRNAIYRWKPNESKIDYEDGKKNIPLQLQRLFLNLQTSDKKSVQTHDLTKSFGWNSEDAFQQHDVQELSRVMFDALEKMFKGTEQKNLINELYQGNIKDYVKCLECNTESARCDVYLDVPLCIRPFGSDKTFKSVEEALDAFVQPEILDENNKYFCSKCNKMCTAHKGLKFDSFPYILSLQLKRFDFDYDTMSRFKLSNSVTFPEVLNVKKYIQHKFQSEKSYLSENDQNVNNEENRNLQSEEEETNKDELYDYELFSIMIHSGSATGGHYYAYIKCFETNQWYNFNDEKVSKLDTSDISRAFGTSYSMYSSATAYMLLYRQIDPKRNQKIIKIEEFDDHIKYSLEKFKKQQIEADMLKEYLDNVCKVKVVVPSINKELNKLDESGKRKERAINIHKDLTLEKAKLEIIKDFDLSEYIETTNQKYRILKYDTYNELIEQSYKNETEITVFEAVGFTKFPYNFSWYLEIIPIEQEFIEYNSNDYKLKIMNLDLATFEVVELFNIRLKDDARVETLREVISEKTNLSRESIRMALERSHSIFNYMYLNENLNDLLKSLNFTRVSKVFIEAEENPAPEMRFEDSRFFYALDAIANMIQMTVFLPNIDQCEAFKLKTKRRLEYIELQNQLAKKAKTFNTSEFTAENIEEDQSNMSGTTLPMSCDVEEASTITSFDNFDASSKMSFQSTVQDDLNKKIVDTRKLDQTNYDEFDTNMVENHFKAIDPLKDEDKGVENQIDTNILSQFDDKNKNPFIDIENSYNEEDDDENDNETHLGDVIERSDVDLAELDAEWTDNPNNIDEDDESNLLIDEYNNDHESTNLNKINPASLFNFTFPNDEISTQSSNKSTKQRVKFSESFETKNSEDLKVPESLNIFSNDSKQSYEPEKETKKSSLGTSVSESRFINSKLDVNEDLGTRILNIKMDKRIDLNEFKAHTDEYLKISNENFRVFRICQNDLECELTSHENQFSYLTQNPKFLIKLGPPLKYGEYVLPVFKLNKIAGSISYMCDFMVVYGLSVLNHKILLKDDLKEECNLEIDVDKMRLRKKISRRPGKILLDEQIFGKDIFVNPTSELCVEILDGPETKVYDKLQTSVYLRHWNSDEYELGDLFEIIVDGNSFETLLENISTLSAIASDELEVLKCKRDFPFKSPILEIHRDPNWKTNYYLQMEKLEDGVCFFYRNKNLDLGTITEEKRRDMIKTDNKNFRPITNHTSRKETGVRIQVENN